MMFYGAVILAVIMGAWFVLWSEEDMKYRVVVAAYVAVIGLGWFGILPLPALVPLIMSCLLVCILVLYLKFRGYWFGN